MTNRTHILDALFINAERFMADLLQKHNRFSNLQILCKVAQDRQKDYINLLVSFHNTQNRSPFNAAHQEIGKRIYKVALKAGYERAEEFDSMGNDIFDNPTEEKFYKLKASLYNND
jgi:hypothetical protein